ncbi:hypothetical protein O181_048646 [Austropuccinia psidii MF-1]|uniref:Uncharacterized protein n=1 Tax=Austropuccinia psidii MF-1 TaxID=1389203 RepID=A0A9Q3HKL4_9BASI|nr:hypothetical protein [Austropuccinia psidii MF-1]
MKMAYNLVMAPQILPQSITQDLPCSIVEGKILCSWTLSMDPGHEGENMVHGPPGTLAYGSSLALGDSIKPHGSQTANQGQWLIGHAKDRKDQKGP